MGELQFLTASRYNLINALIPEEQDKTIAHPIYKGQFLNVWNSIKLMNAKHIYMFFGFNDLGDRTDKIVNRYVQLIHQIQAVNPDVDFTIISTTYIYPGYTKSFPGVKSWAFDNPTVRKLNTEMQKLAQQNGFPAWVEVDAKKFTGTFKNAPARDEIAPEINEALIIERYSR